MRHVTRRLLLVGLAATPAACNGLLPAAPPPPKLFTLTPVPQFPPGTPVSWQLLVDTPVSTAALDTERIALKRSPITVDYFADAAWTDRAPAMVQALIVQSFENSGRIPAIARESLALRADYVLQLELRHFEADYQGAAAPEAHVQIAARLVKMPDRAIIAERSFEASAKAAENSTPAIVEAFNSAFHQVTREMVGWTLAAAR